MRLSLITIIAASAFLLTIAGSGSQIRVQPRDSQVLFVCEHGNVKSLMAMLYFNQLAQERRLPFLAVSRGVAPNSTTVPPAIVAGLRRDGFDVSSFHPSAVTAADVSASQHVIMIGIALPANAQSNAPEKIEQWNDVPAASDNYGAARDSLKRHVMNLLVALGAIGSNKPQIK